MNRGDYRYVDANGHVISKSVYDKYGKANGGYIQYYDGKKWGATKIPGGQYYDESKVITPEQAAVMEKYGESTDGYIIRGNDTEKETTNDTPEIKETPIITGSNDKEIKFNIGGDLLNGTYSPFAYDQVKSRIAGLKEYTSNNETKDTPEVKDIPEVKETPKVNETSKQDTPITNKVNNNMTNNNTNRRKRAVAPDGSIQQGYTQEQFNQRLKDYEMENQQINEAKAKQQALREQIVGAGGLTRDQIFKDALTKFSEDPNSFDASQLTNLYNVGKQLGYYNDTMLDAPAEEKAAQQEAERQAAAKATADQPIAANQGGRKTFDFYV